MTATKSAGKGIDMKDYLWRKEVWRAAWSKGRETG